jgi:hypothetical protein
MERQKNFVKIMWSIWDGDPTVSWRCDDSDTKITLRLPPVSVAALPSHGAIAIAGNIKEFAEANLLLYSYNGEFLRAYSAPPLGGNAQFSGVSEKNGEVMIIVAYETDDGEWVEEAGKLNVETGIVSNLHRSY